MFQYLLKYCFVNNLSADTIESIRICSKTLYNDLENQYYTASKDLYIYTWSRCYNMTIIVWGKAWNHSHTRHIVGGTSIQYEDIKNGSSIITCDELVCDDDIIEDFFNDNYIKPCFIIGKISKGPHLIDCPQNSSTCYI